MFDPFGLAQHWFQVSASGLVDALWNEIWHWGLGIGIIVCCILGIFFIPIPSAKEWLAFAAGGTFILLVAYYAGDRDRAKICEAQVKELYLKAHPGLNANNIAKNWRVSPNWVPGQPVLVPKVKPRTQTCGFGGFGC